MVKSPGNKPLRVMIVDDDPDHAFFVQEAMAASGVQHTCETASGGVDALARMRAGKPLPHLVLLDLNMPIKDGRDVLREMRADSSLAAIPVVVLTTSDNPRDVGDCYVLGASSYVVKPFGLSELCDAMRNVLTYWSTIALVPNRVA